MHTPYVRPGLYTDVSVMGPSVPVPWSGIGVSADDSSCTSGSSVRLRRYFRLLTSKDCRKIGCAAHSGGWF